jgi:hypothetical protein
MPTVDSGGANQIKVAPPPIIVSANAAEGDGKKVYIGPRKLDEAPQATFHYYNKSSKATARGGQAVGGANIPQDKSKVATITVTEEKAEATVK